MDVYFLHLVSVKHLPFWLWFAVGRQGRHVPPCSVEGQATATVPSRSLDRVGGDWSVRKTVAVNERFWDGM